MTDQPRWNEPVLRPTNVKRQHYVPRVYLRPFVGQDDNIRVVDLDTGSEYRTSIENAAVETYFNDLEVEGLRVSTEDWLAELEGKAASVIKQLTMSPETIGGLSLEEELALARFIAALKFRTPGFREWKTKVTSPIISQIKEILRAQLYHQYDRKEADATWEIWKDKPDYWWLGQEAPEQPAEGTTYMLGEVQGFANLLRAAPWRIGRAAGSLRLYTSDNPVSAYLSPVRPWWDGGAFSSFAYYLSLAPDVLLKIDRRPYKDEQGDSLAPQGERRYGDFSDWEVSFAQHVITKDATRFLYGEALVVPRDCATDCLERIGQANLQIAMRYQGFDPKPPAH